jgi:hypothetical protein
MLLETCSCRQTQISNRPKSGEAGFSSRRRYPNPWQYGQLGSPSEGAEVSALEEFFDVAPNFVSAMFFSVASILLFGMSFFLPSA